MKRVAIVQARMGSTRLPGKVLRQLAGAPMLEQQLRRMRRAQTLDAIGIATTEAPADDAVASLAERLSLPCFRGSEDDVLARYLGAARAFSAELVVRVTADCPLIDAGVIDRVVSVCRECDYASNTLVRTYPRGLDVEAFPFAVLERVAAEATSKAAREHVTYYMHTERRDLFVLQGVIDIEDHSGLRWTVDTEEDFELVSKLYELGAASLDYRGVLGIVQTQPWLKKINAHVEQKKA